MSLTAAIGDISATMHMISLRLGDAAVSLISQYAAPPGSHILSQSQNPTFILIFIYLNSFPTPQHNRITSGLCVFQNLAMCCVVYLKRKFPISVRALRTSHLVALVAFIDAK